MAHAPKGYTGTVDQVAEARRMALLGPHFVVAGPSDWTPSVSAGDRAVQVSVGSAEACGVLDSTTTPEVVQFDTNTGGTNRYDLLVARWSWTLMTVVFDKIKGTTAPPLVNTSATVDPAKVNRLPGVQYDAVIAVVCIRPGVGTLLSSDVFDVRTWGGASGPLNIPQSSYLAVVDGALGDQLCAVTTGTVYRHDGTAWQPDRDTRWQTYTPAWTVDGAYIAPNIGNGILAGRYMRTGPRSGLLKIQLTLGTTTGGGDAPASVGYHFSLPPGWTNGPMSSALPGYFRGLGDSGGMSGFLSANDTRILEMRADQNNALVGNGLLIATGDYIILSGVIELAS